jgi:hypothetical protein
MDEPRKVWVIDPEEELATTLQVEEVPGLPWSPEAEKGLAGQRARGRGRAGEPPPSRLHFAALLLLTYALGPLALLLTPRGRRGGVGAALAAVAGLSWALLIWQWRDVLTRMLSGGAAAGIWMALVGLAILTGCGTWSRAVLCTGQELVLQAQRLPRWLRRSRVIGAVGLLVPGLGLLIAGRRRRAAAVLGLMGPFLCAVLILLRAGRIWAERSFPYLHHVPPLSLELVFLGAAAMVAVGTVIWLGQALEGFRLTAVASGRRRGRSDRTAAALLMALLAFGFLFDPTAVAQRLDQESRRLAGAGYQLIPLTLLLSANRLDPAQPVYLLRVSQLYAALGRPQTAARIREELASRWRPCAGWMVQMGQEEPAGPPLPLVRDPALDFGGREGPPAMSR